MHYMIKKYSCFDVKSFLEDMTYQHRLNNYHAFKIVLYTFFIKIVNNVALYS